MNSRTDRILFLIALMIYQYLFTQYVNREGMKKQMLEFKYTLTDIKNNWNE